ncbi:TetR family transcriptional regulator [Planococcus sp. APC 4015]|nr:TetR family transcriptional regulator [Planococcus sp. APC 4015]
MARTDSKPGPRGERGELSARILESARTEFAAQGFAGTTMRAVARAAGVDAALVHHYFGTKETLLNACIEFPASFLERVRQTWQTPAEDLGRALVATTLQNWRSPDSEPVLRAILLIAAHHEPTRERLRQTIAGQLMGPAAIGRTDVERTTRSSLIASQLLGLGLVRYVWQIEPLATLDDAAVIDAVGPTIQRYVDGDLGPTGRDV